MRDKTTFNATGFLAHVRGGAALGKRPPPPVADSHPTHKKPLRSLKAASSIAPAASSSSNASSSASGTASAPATSGPVRAGLPAIRAQVERAAQAARLPPGAAGDPASIAELPAEPVGGGSGPPRFMHGRLRARRAFWRTFVRSTLVLSWITSGFPLVWKDPALPAPPVRLANHNSALAHFDFARGAVAELVATGAARQVDHCPTCVLPLGVVARPGTGKLRLIWDGRWVNHYLDTPSFKYETLDQLGQVVEPGDFIFTCDLTAGYHHVDMHADSVQYMGFEWEGQFYVFTQLPFGLAPACWAFTKITRELLGKWRSAGHRNTGYIDDSLHAARSLAAAHAQRAVVLADFERCGFIVNLKKSTLPSQLAPYLGALVDTCKGFLSVPPDKLKRLSAALAQAVACRRRCQLRSIASVVGTIMSMSYSYGQVSMLMTRRLAIWLRDTQLHVRSLDSHAPLSDAAVAELQFWQHSMLVHNGRTTLWPPTHVHTLIHTDAAGRSEFSFGGWGGWARLNGRLAQAAGRWRSETRATSSTLLETRAVWLVLQSLNIYNELDGQRILLRTDNMNVFYNLNKAGSMVAAVHDICFDLFWYCMQRGIQLIADWIPREQNTVADALSKEQQSCDWQLHPRYFAQLQQMWGPFDIDLFASFTNHQLPVYYSHYYTPDTAGVNAFAHTWGRRAWCNPPFSIIARVLRHAAACGSRMCLIAPYWPHARWWPLLLSAPQAFAPFVRACMPLPRVPDLFLGAAFGNTRQQHAPAWDSLALLLDFAQPRAAPLPLPALR